MTTPSAIASEFEDTLHAFLDLPLVPPSVGIEARRGRRVRAEFGDFAGHSPYSPGEDLRFLDWNALARSGQKVLRSYDEVRHQRLELILDLSASMDARLAGVQHLAWLYVFLGLHRLDSVELTLLAATGLRSEFFAGPESWIGARSVVAGISALGDRGTRDLADRLVGRERGYGRVLVSDFQPEAVAQETLERCAASGHFLICLFPRLPFEAGLVEMPSGPSVLRDPETGHRLEVDMSPALVAAFVEEQRGWEARMALRCRELGHELLAATLPATDDLVHVESWTPFLTRGSRWR